MTELAGGHLTARAARIAAVVAKHGLHDRREKGANRAARLRETLEELGPTFAKLGQILSTRPDLIPPDVAAELARLQDDVPPLTEAQVVQVMEEELKVPWEDVFEHIEPQPLAAGTIGQVHRARLEGGERVVIKVQRPGAAEEIERDLGLFALFAEKVEGREALSGLIDIPAVVEHLASSLRRELDFREEPANIERMREVLAPYSRLDVPGVHKELSSRRLLVMDEVVGGGPLRDAPQGDERREAARQLLESFYRAGADRGLLPRRPAPRQPPLGGRQDLAPRPRHGRDARRGAARPPAPAAARLLARGRRLPRRCPAHARRRAERRRRRGAARRPARVPRALPRRRRSATSSSDRCSTG